MLFLESPGAHALLLRREPERAGGMRRETGSVAEQDGGIRNQRIPRMSRDDGGQRFIRAAARGKCAREAVKRRGAFLAFALGALAFAQP